MKLNVSKETSNNSLSKDDIHCIVCESTADYQKIFKNYKKDGQRFDIYFCPECHVGITSYRDHQSRFIYPVEKFIGLFRNLRHKHIKKIIPKGRILDIGCARGVFLSMMRESGWETFGTELNEETAFHAKNILGLDVKIGRLADIQFESEFFDVITIWHVLDHLQNPALTLQECNRILKSCGLLVIAVPNSSSLQAKISGRYWFHLDPPFHLFHFNEKNLSQLLQKFEFGIIKVNHFSWEFNPFGYLQSFLNMCGIQDNLLYDILKKRSLRSFSSLNSGSFRFYCNLFITLLLVPLFTLLSFLFSFIESLLGLGGSIEVYAIKEGKQNKML
jgi:SAM-dependent methyltransferase